MIVIIPSRYDSVRLPGKPLADLHGKSLIETVYRCAQACQASRVVVATDDERILSAVKGFGGEAIMTSDAHQSGTDRINEAINILSLDDNEIIINLQGDEPLMPAALINKVAEILEHDPDTQMATACFEITDKNDFNDSSLVKVVFNNDHQALYFSRAPIPWPANQDSSSGMVFGYGHIGIYGYRAGFVKKFSQWPVCELEKTEKLEQLRVLHNGVAIKIFLTQALPGPGVDTPADLELVRNILSKQKHGAAND
jgi:3-deoxy-manno-octulosonate cytidylyltransferase (CMP-KDO synthetase)